MPVLCSYRNQSIDLHANQLTGCYMRATLAFNGLNGAAIAPAKGSIFKSLLFTLNTFALVFATVIESFFIARFQE